jgi:hypothetical protein
VLPTTATHYLTNCTRALRFLGSLDLRLATLFGAEKIDAFSRRLRSLPREVRFFPRELFVPGGWCLFASLVSSPLSLCRPHVFAWLSGYEESDQDRFFRASVKEGAKIAIRNEFHRWVLGLPSLSSTRGFATATERERVVFCSPQFPAAFPCPKAEELTPDLPLRALAPAHASSLRASSESEVRASFSAEFPCLVARAGHDWGKEQQPSIIDFCN